MTKDALDMQRASAAVSQWRARLQQLIQAEIALAEAMTLCAANGTEVPRELVISAERLREDVDVLFQVALDAIDSQSAV